VPEFLRLKNGSIVPSHFAGGSFDALKFKPRSLSYPNSFYQKLLRVLLKHNIVGSAGRSSKEITTLYNEEYGERKSHKTIAKYLSRMTTWGYIEQIDNITRPIHGLWSLKADILAIDPEKIKPHSRDVHD